MPAEEGRLVNPHERRKQAIQLRQLRSANVLCRAGLEGSQPTPGGRQSGRHRSRRGDRQCTPSFSLFLSPCASLPLPPSASACLSVCLSLWVLFPFRWLRVSSGPLGVWRQPQQSKGTAPSARQTAARHTHRQTRGHAQTRQSTLRNTPVVSSVASFPSSLAAGVVLSSQARIHPLSQLRVPLP